MSSRQLVLVLAVALAVAAAWMALGRVRRVQSLQELGPPSVAREPAEPAALAPALAEQAATARSAAAGEERPPEEDEEAGEEPDPPTPDRPGPGQALLRVQVVALETEMPLHGADLALFAVEEDGREWLFSTQADPARGVEGDDVVTDAAGRGEFVLQAGVAYRLRGRGPHGLADEVEVELAPFREGEERTQRLALPTAWTRDWHGRVVDGESELPLAGVEVVASSTSAADSIDELVALARGRTGADGRIVLRLPSWGRLVTRCALAGYFARGCEVTYDASTRETPQVVALLRPAALEGTALDAAGQPLEGVEVQLSVPSWQILEDVFFPEDPRWIRVTDRAGNCVFEELPTRADVYVQLRQGDRVIEWTRSSSDVLRLEPGERRSIVWRLPGGSLLQGCVVDGAGVPLAGLPLVLRVSSLPLEHEAVGRFYLGRPRSPTREWRTEPVVARTETDGDGRFTIASVPPGAWEIAAGERWLVEFPH